MIDNRPLLFAVTLACLAMTGCGKKAAEGNKAAGEVLEGTISDAMISPDRVRSEPPIAPRHEGSADIKAGAKGQPKPASDAAEPDALATPDASAASEPNPAPKPTASEPAA